MCRTWAALKQANGKKPAVSAHVNKKDVDALEKILYEATYKRKGGGLQAQERLINDTFKIFDENCSGTHASLTTHLHLSHLTSHTLTRTSRTPPLPSLYRLGRQDGVPQGDGAIRPPRPR